MKKQLLFMATMLFGITSVLGTTAGYAVLNGEDYNTDYIRFAEPIVFIERGVEFLIFPDGSFDFNTELFSNSSTVYYRRNTRRQALNGTYGAPTIGNQLQDISPIPRGVIITHDSNGLVRRIGNVFINYDRIGRIKRAGSVYMSYQRRNGLLKQVGGLRVNYNRWGQLVNSSGTINNSYFNYNTNGYQNYSVAYNNIDNYNDDFYYYRKNGMIKKSKKRK